MSDKKEPNGEWEVLASNPYGGKFQSLNDILSAEDKLKLLDDMLNPKPNPAKDRFLKECRQLRKQCKEKSE